MLSAAERIAQSVDGLGELARAVAGELAGTAAEIATLYIDTLKAGGTLYFAGNGGSAADAQHIAAEYVVRYARSRRALPAVALTTDTSILTACANDLGFDEVFARQVDALVRPGDVLVLHSTSGESPNILRAAQTARTKGVKVVAFLGKGGGPAKDLVDASVVIPSVETSHIQAMHMALEHAICEVVEEELA